ncbi:hypothetical protein PTSG_05107 [Salpingoeca rosetta]|uniref:Glycerophosphodiesterase GDE1 n=1 Tax=Salpingoeca rosetta (strain ATCC 50818 / BSB-021) TaxID=946362 RepID=F2UAJ4_SALR5|nr:uncharacterized protein PTSG_05107 [Salpingoeca rosetta]EGD73410.1 hypothetical protein PTSG_05107 [Salpingoeca rosetta]|eukprot:XP_004993692.1 hypothetical protein PTSG_05107 [Salpingoeca rosetta]
MKFGKTIRNKALPQWAMHYMDYKALKKIIRKCVAAQMKRDATRQAAAEGRPSEQVASSPTTKSATSTAAGATETGKPPTSAESAASATEPTTLQDDEREYETCVTYFFFLLQRQLEKVSDLFADESTLLQARLMAITDKFNRMAVDSTLPEPDFRRQAVAQLLRGINDLLTTQHNLRDFSHMNKEGFRKILKKLDKQLGTSYSAKCMNERVNVASFATCSETLDPLEHRARRLKLRLERVLGIRGSSSAMRLLAKRAPPHATTPASASASEDDEDEVDIIHDVAGGLSDSGRPVWHAGSAATGDVTSLSGGAMPHNLGQLLDTARFTDLDAALLHVEPMERTAIMDELLVRACKTANSDAIAYCVKHKANSLHHTEPHGYTCWHILVRRNRLPQLELLAKLSHKRQVRRACTETDAMGETVLHLAAAFGRVDALRLFRQHSADLDVMASNGFTPLLAAIHRSQTQAALALIEMDADPDLFNSELSSCLSPLAMAAQQGDAVVVRALLDAGADDNVADIEGELALHKACAHGHVDVVRMLVEHNPDSVNRRDEYELHTPLFLCAKHNNQECARVLLAHGAAVNVRDIRGWTPHSYAMYYGYIAFGEELISWGEPGAVACRCGEGTQSAQTHAHAHTRTKPRDEGGGSGDAASAVGKEGMASTLARREQRGSATSHDPYVHYHMHRHDPKQQQFRDRLWSDDDDEDDEDEDEGDDEGAEASHAHHAPRKGSGGRQHQQHQQQHQDEDESQGEGQTGDNQQQQSEQEQQEQQQRRRRSKLLANPRQPLDVTSFIDKEGKYRMRGSEKTVPMSQRTYGHEYLHTAARAFVDISPMRNADRMALFDAEGLRLNVRQCMLQCAISFQTEPGAAPMVIDSAHFKALALPLNEDGDSFSFDIPVEDVKPHATLEFRLVSVFDPTVVVACGRLPDRVWQNTDEQHTTHEVMLLNRHLHAVFPLRFRYLLVLPYLGSELRIQPSNTYWTTRKQLPVWGHRGTGSSKAAHVDSNTYRTHVQENTVLSFVTAANLGAEYVEFDVQLTRDNVPVIYHNWTLADVLGFDVPIDIVTLDAFLSIRERRKGDAARFGLDSDSRLSVRERTPVPPGAPRIRGSTSSGSSLGSQEDVSSNSNSNSTSNNTSQGSGKAVSPPVLSAVPAHVVSSKSKYKPQIQQQQQQQQRQQQQQQQQQPRRNPASHESSTSFAVTDTSPSPFKPSTVAEARGQRWPSGRPRAYSNPELSSVKTQGLDIDPKRYVRAPLATLQEALTLVPESLGFNIEIKYPLEEHQKLHKLQSWEMNTFVDTTLDIVFRHAGDRKIVFSCFHPDMCRILSLKQPSYPVLFLTTAGHKEVFTDARAMSLRAAVRFASSANLLGIVSNSHPLVLCPELIHQVKSSGLLLLTWGDENNDVDCVRLQEACGVDAVIVDHIAHIRKGLRPRDEEALA